jgi:hypothetical protein
VTITAKGITVLVKLLSSPNDDIIVAAGLFATRSNIETMLQSNLSCLELTVYTFEYAFVQITLTGDLQ